MTPNDAIVLPNPNRRFESTAARLATLAPGHWMADWLSLMARIASAQQLAVAAVSAIDGIAPSAIDLALSADIPPIQANGHRRDPAWRTALTHLLDAVEVGTLPPQAQAITARLHTMGPDIIEALADRVLRDDLQAADAGAALYVAAALQVYFTSLVAKLPVNRLRPSLLRGLCPCCGSTPSAGVIVTPIRSPAVRYLYCSLCSTAWTHPLATCITCGDPKAILLQGIRSDADIVRAEICDKCRTYAKMICEKRGARGDPYADDLASLALDVMVAEAGWSRHAPNPLLPAVRATGKPKA